MTRNRRRIPGPHITTDAYGHKMIDGYTYLGRYRTPPMPNRIAMVDRTLATVGVLSHTGTPGALTIDIVPVNTRWTDVTTYGPYDGPYFEEYRLYLDNGVLAAEYALGYGSQTILTRRNFETTVLKVTINPLDGSVVYTEYEL